MPNSSRNRKHLSTALVNSDDLLDWRLKSKGWALVKSHSPLLTTARDSRPCRREACLANVLDKPKGQSNEELAVQVCASGFPCSFRNCLRHKDHVQGFSWSLVCVCWQQLSNHALWLNITTARQGQVFSRVEPSLFWLFNDQLKIQMLIFGRQGNGKGIQATVLVPITSLNTRNTRHYMEEDETGHSSRRGVSVWPMYTLPPVAILAQDWCLFTVKKPQSNVCWNKGLRACEHMDARCGKHNTNFHATRDYVRRLEDNSSWPGAWDKAVLRATCCWLQDAIIPSNPAGPDFIQLVPCAYADDFAVAASSFRRLMTALTPSFKVVDQTAGLNLNHRKCCRVQYGRKSCQPLLEWVATNCEEFREMKLVEYATHVGTMIGPEGHIHRWTAPRKKFSEPKKN